MKFWIWCWYYNVTVPFTRLVPTLRSRSLDRWPESMTPQHHNNKLTWSWQPFFGALGCTSAIVFTCFGAAYGTAKAGVGVCGMAVLRPDLIVRSASLPSSPSSTSTNSDGQTSSPSSWLVLLLSMAWSFPSWLQMIWISVCLCILVSFSLVLVLPLVWLVWLLGMSSFCLCLYL